MSASATRAGQIPIESRLGRLVVATTVLGSAVAMMTATVVNVALPAIAADLGASSAEQQWVINAYLLTIASLILIGGTLADRFGRLRIYRLGIIGFAAASLLCAIAPNIEVLIAARLVQGAAGALLTPGSLAIIEASLRKEDRGRGVGQWSGLIGVAGAVGPLIGGILVDFSWRWVFLINLPVALVVLVLMVRLPETFDESAEGSHLDFSGAVLAVLALGGVSYGLIQGPTRLDALTIGAVVVAVAAFVALVVIEPRRARPMVPIDLFANRVFSAANLVTLLVYGGMGVVFFLLTIQLQVTAGWSPLEAGAALLPVTALMLVLSSRAGDLAQRIGPRLPLAIGSGVIAVGMALFTRIGPDASYVSDVLPAVIIFGLGLSACVAPVTSAALGSVPDTRSGAASGVNNAISRSGQLLAIAAIPPAVGLTGDALSDPVQLDAGFADAMLIGAAIVAAGGVAAALLLRESGDPAESDDGAHHTHCHVDGPHPRPRRVAGAPASR